ncbi:methyltransferase domain-containing protein [Chlorobaculum sp. 24CR]|uniref:methyltransferase domain-containing protein n=1 Tax=Chlorobaculum sp. 24CR TaxID=2508878 RepID=UPI00100B930C|nr:methyltransferase domain-containing protein [Chlorobaculum sp. 24CR]RXK88794.1 methyltransferase domain-containing protein [Chlorobaculum sp. 24CR]
MTGGQPFRTVVDQRWSADPAHRMRWEKSLAFVRASAAIPLPARAGLDIGDRTPATAMLEAHFGCRFETTSVDLDTEPLDRTKRYPVVTAFEVIEHLYNPLHLLLQIRDALDPAPSSRLFLSTPAWKPGFLQSHDHFHEMPKRSLDALVARAGFEVVRSAEFGIRSPLFCLRGVRPMLRCVFEKIRMYELAARR